MVDVFEMSTMDLFKESKNVIGGDILADLVKIGVEPDSIPNVYMHLVKNVDALKGFNGISIDKRNEMLHHIVPNNHFH
jgi:hypothetical protein